MPALTEVEVEGVGTMRHLNNWQIMAIRKMPNRERRADAELAFGLGMTVRQFRGLSIRHQKAAREAHNRLYSPQVFNQPKSENATVRLPRPYERVPENRIVALGAELLQMKRELPYGHFQRWVEEEAGITYSQARRFVRAAQRLK